MIFMKHNIIIMIAEPVPIFWKQNQTLPIIGQLTAPSKLAFVGKFLKHFIHLSFIRMHHILTLN